MCVKSGFDGLYHSYNGVEKVLVITDMSCPGNTYTSFRELRIFLACVVFYESTCMLGTGQ